MSVNDSVSATNSDGSGKSGSNRSAISSARDMTKDNTTSPIDLECHIQAARITKILDETIYRIKLVICIPALIQEYNFLSSILSTGHVADCLFVYNQFDSPLYSSSFLNVVAKEDVQGGDLTLKNRLNPELSHMVHIFGSYSVLKPKIEELIEQMKKDYLEYHCNDIKGISKSTSPLEFLMTFEKFRDLMVVQMETTAADELAKKIKTRKLKKSNEELIEAIEEYKKNLKDESDAFDKDIKEKQDTIKRLEQELAILKQDAMIKLKKKILDSDRQMVLATRAHVVKAEILKEEDTETTSMYQSQLKQHLMDEKNMRARRFKVETQLLSWIQKYDIEMADKQVELDEFTDLYDEELKLCEGLEEDLAEQDKEYIPLMAEREEEYHQEMTEKMNKFLLEHAVRVIQTAWRDVLANRAEKKKLKKLLKKMEQEAAAKAAAEAAAARAAAAAAKAAAKAEKKKK